MENKDAQIETNSNLSNNKYHLSKYAENDLMYKIPGQTNLSSEDDTSEFKPTKDFDLGNNDFEKAGIQENRK